MEIEPSVVNLNQINDKKENIQIVRDITKRFKMKI